MRHYTLVSNLCLLIMFVSFCQMSLAAKSAESTSDQAVVRQAEKDTAANVQRPGTGLSVTGTISFVSAGADTSGVILLRSAFISAGGTDSSVHYSTTSSAGQMIGGVGSSPSYQLSHGIVTTFGCCVDPTGNVNMSGIVDGGDLALLVAYLTNVPAQKPTLPCPEEANVNSVGIVDGGDLALLVAYLTNPPGQKPTLPNCP